MEDEKATGSLSPVRENREMKQWHLFWYVEQVDEDEMLTESGRIPIIISIFKIKIIV